MSVSEVAVLHFAPIELEHLDTVLAIETEAYPEPWSEGMFRDEIRSARSHFFVVLIGETVVGYGGFWLVADEAHITSVTIRDCCRGLGYGRRLLEFLLAQAVAVEARLATLEVRLSNATARNLYQRLGFRPIGLRKNYYPKSREDAVVMVKHLDPHR